MDSDKPPNGYDLAPAEFWEKLNPELRECAVRLLAQMAYKLVAAEIERMRPSATHLAIVQAKDGGDKDRPRHLKRQGNP